MKIFLIISILAFSSSIVSGQQKDTIKSKTLNFKPSWAVGILYYWEYGNDIVGFKGSYNIELFRKKTGSLVLEPALSFGSRMTDARYGAKAFITTNLSLLYRQKLGPIMVGLGPSYDLTSDNNAFGYLGILGLTSRLGYIVSEKLLLELHGNFYINSNETNIVKMGTGINLIRLIRKRRISLPYP